MYWYFLMYLGTHDIQNVSVVAVDSKPGEALIGCSFVSGSNSMGYLAIITDKNTSVFQYHVVQRQEDQQIDTISNLATGEHRALLFSVQSNGMPQAASVNLPRNVSIINGALVNTSKLVNLWFTHTFFHVHIHYSYCTAIPWCNHH